MTTTRRTFLKLIAALPLAAAAAQTASAAHANPASPARLLLNRFSVAGFQYYDGPALVPRLKPDAQLKLTREPGNPHDPFAVEIHFERAKLGYVPRSDNTAISRLQDQGATLACRVAEVDAEARVWNMVRVEVWMA